MIFHILSREKKIGMLSLGIFGIFVAAVIFSTSALAYPAPTIGSKAPTHNSSSVAGNNQTPWSAVGKGAFNGQYTWYKVYVPVGTKTTVTIDQACSSSIEVGQPVVRYTLSSMRSTEDSIDPSKYADEGSGENSATGQCRESVTFDQINASESAPSRYSGNVSEVAGHDGRNGNQKYMVFYLRARIGNIGGGDHERSFRVSATGSALIGASSWSGVPDAEGYFGIYQRDAPQLGSQRWSYELQFASDCNAGLQPTGNTQIPLYDMDNGVYDPLNTVKYDIDRAPRGTDNWVSWRFTSANDPGGSGNRTLLNFNYNVDYKYRLRINSVNYRNTLQMRLPFKFDQINALNSVDCTQTKEWHLTPDTKARIQAGSYNPVENSEGEWRWGPSVDAAVEAFKQARISEGVTETKGQRVESSQHNWRVEYKYIRGDTGAESSLHTKSANYNNSVSAGRTKVFTENSQVPTSASSGIRFLFGDAYEGSSSASKRTPRPNDQYCERLVNTKAEGGTVDTPSAWGCVALSGAPACLPWQVQATASMNQTQGYGDISAAWVGDRYNFNYNFWHIGLAEQTAPINFAHNETNNYLGAVSLGEWAYTSVRGPIGRESGGQSYPDSMNYQPKALNCPGGLDESHTTVLGGTITVPYYYNIKPSGQRSTGIGSTVEQGDPVSGDGSISIDESGVDIGASPSIPAIRGDASSDRSTTRSRSTASELVARRYDPAPANTLVEERRTGQQWSELNYDVTRTVNANNLTAVTFTPAQTATYPVGTRICYSMAVHNPTHHDTGWAESAQDCTTIIKTPKIRFENQDVSVGKQTPTVTVDCAPSTSLGEKKIATSSAPAVASASGSPYAMDRGSRANLYGSWVEYGAFATGSLDIGTSTIPAVQTGYNKLAFGNTSTLGGYTYPGTKNRCAPSQPIFQLTQNLAAGQLTEIAGSQVDIKRLATADDRVQIGDKHRRVSIKNGNLELADTTAPEPVSFKSRDIILRASKGSGDCGGKGTITIKQNIEYDFLSGGGTYANVAELPRIILAADCDIVIGKEVTRIDAWLVAGRNIVTCDERNSAEGNDPNSPRRVEQMTQENCKQPLVVNGPAFAKKLYALRTTGSDLTSLSDVTTAAETFNLRPDQLLTNYFHNRNNGSYVQVRETSLPPRY